MYGFGTTVGDVQLPFWRIGGRQYTLSMLQPFTGHFFPPAWITFNIDNSESIHHDTGLFSVAHVYITMKYYVVFQNHDVIDYTNHHS